MAGLTPRTAKFVKRYAALRAVLGQAARSFGDEVVSGAFPTAEYSYH
jgi:3-methyl-2-oxobutanoate hydroxymethyltransferase